MPIYQSSVSGQRYLTVVEKVTGEEHSLLMQLSYDVALSRLVKQIAMEFQAGQGWSRVPTGSDVAPTGDTLSFGPIEEAPRAYELKASGGSALNQGLSFYENDVEVGATVELHLRS